MADAQKIPIEEQSYFSKMQEWRDQMDRKVLTAAVGEIVLWYNGGVIDEANAVAAVVTRIERPGVLTLAILRPQAPLAYKNAVQYDRAVSEAERKGQVVYSNGTWDLLRHATREKRHVEPWREMCQQRIDVIENQLNNFRQAKANAAKSPPQ